MDFVQSKSMGCGSTPNLLLGAGSMGEQVEDGAEGGGAAECIGVMVEVVGFLDIII